MAYGVILPTEVLRVPRHGFINIHFSLLPAWRGAAPVQRGIENGDEYSGISIFQLDPGIDTGPIYLQEKVKIGERENSGELLGRLATLAPECIRQTLPANTNGSPNAGAATTRQSSATRHWSPR